jgi:hypothetical protein
MRWYARIKPDLDQCVPPGVASGGEQNGKKDESFHSTA